MIMSKKMAGPFGISESNVRVFSLNTGGAFSGRIDPRKCPRHIQDRRRTPTERLCHPTVEQSPDASQGVLDESERLVQISQDFHHIGFALSAQPEPHQHGQETGPTQDEFQYMQNAVRQSEALRYETPGAKLGLLDQILTYDLPLDYRDQQKALLQATDRATLSKLAASLLQPENLAIIVVGDAATLTPQLQQLPWPLTELDAEGYAVPEAK
jgi:hypothetical protein